MENTENTENKENKLADRENLITPHKPWLQVELDVGVVGCSAPHWLVDVHAAEAADRHPGSGMSKTLKLVSVPVARI
ncbi:hypothetical protein EYF80_041884 [Liparis tanakae]|uniref:Uncharacterized protein n=1 Tax=Liparis tanakae TaxID=230148 RepID=A0A4Z2G3P2_9TELE|nr:hypothetical protein EYF80_041884 [Liparis tanakae]